MKNIVALVLIAFLLFTFKFDASAQDLVLGADVNGDGYEDKVSFMDTKIQVELGRADGRYNIGKTALVGRFCSSDGWDKSKHVRTFGDVNGDGRADLVGFGNDAVYVSFGNPDGTFAPFKIGLRNQFCIDDGWKVDQHTRLIQDVNNDGLGDIHGYGDQGSEWVAYSNGDGTFQPAVRID